MAAAFIPHYDCPEADALRLWRSNLELSLDKCALLQTRTENISIATRIHISDLVSRTEVATRVASLPVMSHHRARAAHPSYCTGSPITNHRTRRCAHARCAAHCPSPPSPCPSPPSPATAPQSHWCHCAEQNIQQPQIHKNRNEKN